MDIPSDQLLLSDSWAPVTETIGFVEGRPEHAAQAFLDWQGDIYGPMGGRFEVSTIEGSIQELLPSLLPLSIPTRHRFLFIPTQSSWTAYIENGSKGVDAAGPMSVLRGYLHSRGVRVTAVPQSLRKVDGVYKGRYGALILELYDRNTGGRSISLANDGGRWKFYQSGTPLPFENTQAYSAPRVTDRFSLTELKRCLQELGLRPFEESFYAATGGQKAYRLELKGLQLESTVESSLEQARAEF